MAATPRGMSITRRLRSGSWPDAEGRSAGLADRADRRDISREAGPGLAVNLAGADPPSGYVVSRMLSRTTASIRCHFAFRPRATRNRMALALDVALSPGPRPGPRGRGSPTLPEFYRCASRAPAPCSAIATGRPFRTGTSRATRPPPPAPSRAPASAARGGAAGSGGTCRPGRARHAHGTSGAGTKARPRTA